MAGRLYENRHRNLIFGTDSGKGAVDVHIPPAFAEKIPRIFGEEGTAWLAQLPELLAVCQERWHLTSLRLAAELSYNLVCFAESPAFGAVALKVGVPNPELYTEMKALALYSGRDICTCHDADAELGALLLERIVPGTDLTTVRDGEARFRTAARLIASLPLPLAGDHGFPAYGDWVSRAFAWVRQVPGADAKLLSLAGTAERCFREIDTPDRPRVLLHGDLHHLNILRDRGGWKAIDPKGVIGVPCLEAARFMQNELGMGDPGDRLARLDQMTVIFAEHLQEEKRVLARCAFVDQVLATCWSVEENAPSAELQTAEEKCEALLSYCSRL
jgi:streptomycin 6-kinase